MFYTATRSTSGSREEEEGWWERADELEEEEEAMARKGEGTVATVEGRDEEANCPVNG